MAKQQADFGAFPREQFAGRSLGSALTQPRGPPCLQQLPQFKEIAGVQEADPRACMAWKPTCSLPLLPPASTYHSFVTLAKQLTLSQPVFLLVLQVKMKSDKVNMVDVLLCGFTLLYQ